MWSFGGFELFVVSRKKAQIIATIRETEIPMMQ